MPPPERHHAVPLPTHGEDGRLRRTDDGGKPIRPTGPEVGQAEGGAFQLLAFQPAAQGALHGLTAAARELGHPDPIDVMKHRHQQAILDGDHQTDMGAVRRQERRVGRVGDRR